ncbi:MAG: hypothetical protein GF418_09200 [Chitinivibrionales bacterium]|nr:hypothetical protein [Chitinivibrionales bacterium]MBD3395784.1 hypothetical protein [Chitinivibrionales bacterium]
MPPLKQSPADSIRHRGAFSLRMVDPRRERYQFSSMFRARMTARIIWILLAVAAARVRAFEFPYDNLHHRTLHFLHPFANYEMLPSWQRLMEDSLFAASMIRLNYGSVTLKEMMTDIDVRINQELDHGFWFFFRHHTYQTHHLDLDEQSNFVGIEKYILGPLSAFLHADFMREKEFADIQVGVSVADSSRCRYVRLAVRFEDFMYDFKNELGGNVLQDPLALVWHVNYGFGPVKLFSEGSWTRGFRREYADSIRSPDMSYHRQRHGNALVRLMYALSSWSSVQAELFHYRFSERKRFHDALLSYRFDNALYHAGATWAFTLRDIHLFRLGPRLVFNHARAGGYRDYTYDRREVMPVAAYDLLWKKNSFGLSYYGTAYRWDWDARDTLPSIDKDGYTAKGMFTYGRQLWEHAHVRGSYSHVLDVPGFNGWNVQYIMTF